MANSNDNAANSFTFVDYQNTPNHSASHRRAVKSHISSKYRTSVRQQKQPRYALPQRSPLAANEAAGRGSEGSEVSSVDRRRLKRSQTQSPATPQTLSFLQTPSPLEMNFNGIRTDPFDVLPGQRTPCVRTALDYYTQVLSPLHEPLLMAMNTVNPMMTWVYPLILNHESAFHGAVALSQAYLEKRQNPIMPFSREVDFHRRKAIAVLSEHLSKQDKRPDERPDDATLMTVLALAALDVLDGSDNIAHRKGLALVVARKGGLDKLGCRGLVKAYLIQFDYFWMLETGAQSIFPLAKRKQNRIYPQHPFDSDMLELIGTLPDGFKSLAYQGTLGVDVVEILSRVNRFALAKENNLHLPLINDPIPDGQDYQDIFDTCSCLHASASTVHSLEKNICLAIILFCFDIHSPAGISAKITPYRGARQELTRSLRFTPCRNAAERACLIWIWMIVIASWKLDHDLSHESLWLCQTFFEKFPEARSWSAISHAMQQFLWYEPLKQAWRTSWREALSDHQQMQQNPRFMETGEEIQRSPLSSSGTKHSTRESTPASASSGGFGEDWARPRSLPTRTRGTSQATDHNNAAEDGTPGPPRTNVPLPPMFTLETYLGEIQ
ncbi:uncharacterized protein PV06_09247 [Exophiala oligosperma]|uniref:Transcription factor domain-containing protein n=1 Tax=Exophiala oligosperma TaxID=215243 RepID=A0A0D2ADH5_9EURO|nr:uncharacterized protein PV06_09247 [Exophiala oligosperma]KIW38266.1 hypothetical protein PV06_09247 [Exophiala oligosperma]